MRRAPTKADLLAEIEYARRHAQRRICWVSPRSEEALRSGDPKFIRVECYGRGMYATPGEIGCDAEARYFAKDAIGERKVRT